MHGLLAPGRIAEGEHASRVEFRVYDANGDHDAGFKGCKISDGNGHEYTFTGATNEKADITGWDYDHIKIEPNTGGAYSFNGTAWLYTENDPHPIQFNSGVHHDSGSITEDQNSMVQGFIDAHPSDGSDIDFTPVHMAGTYGTLDLQADGTWKYTLDTVKSDGLNDGDLKQEAFTVSTSAGDHHDINIDVHGHTDGPSSLLPPPPPPPAMADTPQNADTLNADVLEEPVQNVDVSFDDPQVKESAVTAENTLADVQTLSAPVDHYLQMVGISQEQLAPQIENAMADGLPAIQELASTGSDADMLDINQVDVFASPLEDDDKDGLNHDNLSVLDDSSEDQVIDPINDDDSLHQALNDMHSQI